jgi:hypothetical protein
MSRGNWFCRGRRSCAEAGCWFRSLETFIFLGFCVAHRSHLSPCPYSCFAFHVLAALDLDNDPVICLPPCPSTSGTVVGQAGPSSLTGSSSLPPLPTGRQSRSNLPSIVGGPSRLDEQCCHRRESIFHRITHLTFLSV